MPGKKKTGEKKESNEHINSFLAELQTQTKWDNLLRLKFILLLNPKSDAYFKYICFN